MNPVRYCSISNGAKNKFMSNGVNYSPQKIWEKIGIYFQTQNYKEYV